MIERVAPARLGTGFRWLLASAWVGNLGDGLAVAAGPLLIASQTRDPLLIASASFLQWAPPLLFGLFAGVLSDRVDRRRMVVVGDLVRVAVLVALVAAIAADRLSIALVLGALFLLGTAEVFADNAASTLLPMLVGRDDLALGNARLTTAFVTLNQLAGPPLGAFLFAAGIASPFAAQAVLLAAAAALISRIGIGAAHRERAAPSHLRRDVVEAFAWVRRHAAVRTLVLTILVFNVTFGAAWSVLVLYATERLGLSSVGFGLLTTMSALGGLAGTAAYGWITRHVSLGNVMRIGLIVETVTHLSLALTTNALVAYVIFVFFGAHAFIWATTSITIRQRAVPSQLQGRVGAVNLLGVYAGLVVGAGLGGVLARWWGVTAPFRFAFVGSALFVVVIWPQLIHLKHADEASAPLPVD